MINNIESTLNYTFKDKNLLKIALTHSSLSNEIGGENYERLEFLGDAVIEFVVSDRIYKYAYLDSGCLTKLRASLVSTSNFSLISTQLGIDKCLQKSKSLSTLSNKTKADILESVIGAIYLDGGIDEASRIIDKYILINEENIRNHVQNSIDYKTKLQEEMQANKQSFRYETVSESGLSHNKTFEVQLIIDEKIISTATGKSLHSAQFECARKYFEHK